jgi:hypothetical protein
VKHLFFQILSLFVFGNVWAQFNFELENIFISETSSPFLSQVVDINGDGHQDILVCNSGGSEYGSVVWYENDGDANFVAHGIKTSNPYAKYATVVDIDKDNDQDIVVCMTEDDVIWLENNGSGEFEEHVVSNEIGRPRNVFALDMDKDGDIDIITADNKSSNIICFKNDSLQNFTTEVIITEVPKVESIFCTDFDNDGNLDVLSLSYSVTYTEKKTSLFLNNGSQEFTELIIGTSSTSPKLYYVYATDFDKDDDKDVIALIGGDVIWYENEGNEIFAEENVIASIGDRTLSIPVNDINKDGYLDFSFVRYNNGFTKFYWSENDTTMDFDLHAIGTNDDHTVPNKVHTLIADIDEDGDFDIIYSSSSINTVGWYENNGSQKFKDHPISTSVSGTADIITVDFDQDGDMDVLTASSSDGKISWFRNDGNQNFEQQIIDKTIYLAQSLVCMDYDMDGDSDVVVMSNHLSGITWFENDNYSFNKNKVATASSASGRDIYSKDLDLDGDLDLIAGAGGLNQLYWVKNNEQGSWYQYKISQNMERAFRVVADDFDGDQDVDIVAADDYERKILVFTNDGKQEFTNSHTLSFSVSLTDLIAADIDQDGTTEFLVTSSNDFIYMFRYDSLTDDYERILVSDEVGTPRTLCSKDIDQDGDMDILTMATYPEKTVILLENLGNDLFLKHDLTLNNTGFQIACDNMDGDDDLDIVFGYGTKLFWLKNKSVVLSNHNDKVLFERKNVFPNPSNEFVNVGNIGDLEDATVSIYSLKGQLVFTKEHITENSIQINVSELDGFYELIITSKQGVDSYNLMVK